MAMFQEQ